MWPLAHSVGALGLWGILTWGCVRCAAARRTSLHPKLSLRGPLGRLLIVAAGMRRGVPCAPTCQDAEPPPALCHGDLIRFLDKKVLEKYRRGRN